MKKIITVCFLFLVGNCFGQQVTFQKTYSTPQGVTATSGIHTKDGGFAIAGKGQTLYSSVYLLKTDSSGTTQWVKTFQDIVDIQVNSIGQTFDKGYIIGCNQSIVGGNSDFLLLKTDSSGNASWIIKYDDFGGDDYLSSAIQTSDSGFIMIGITSHPNPCCSNDIYIIKTDLNGTVIWNKKYSGSNTTQIGLSIQETNDNGFIFSGTRGSNPSGPFATWIFKIDSAGNHIWDRIYHVGEGISINTTSDNGYILTGSELGSDQGIILLRTDSSGILIWGKLFQRIGIPDIGIDVIQTSDNGFIVTGRTGNDLFMIKTDTNGDTLWTRIYGGISYAMGCSIIQTTDGGYLSIGSSDLFGTGESSIYLIKTDSYGNSECNKKKFVFNVNSFSSSTAPITYVTSASSYSSLVSLVIDSAGNDTTLCTTVGVAPISNFQSSIFNISPNPAINNFTITFPNTIYKGVIEIYNVLGEKIFSENFTDVSQKEIRLNKINAGIYFVKVRDGEKEYSKKLVIE
jgi:hypothetical protein